MADIYPTQAAQPQQPQPQYAPQYAPANANFDGANFGQTPPMAQVSAAKANGYNISGNDPIDINGWQILGQTALGVVIGILIAFLLFVILTIVGTMFTDAMTATAQATPGISTSINPLVPLVLMLIAFVSTLVGSLMTAGLYSMLYSKFYYDSGRMLKLVTLANVMIFIAVTPIYLLFMNDMTSLFFVSALHVFFSIFISYCMMSFATNPNYSGSYLIGNMAGFVGSLLLYAVATSQAGGVALDQKLYILMLAPSVLSFSVIPLVSGMRNLVYYKFYEMGTNFFYIPSISDVLADQSEVQDSANVQEDSNVRM